MRYSSLTVVCVGTLVVGLTPMLAAAQATNTLPPRTAWGQPDLGGVWEFRTRTPLQRPERHADREFLSEEEAAELERIEIERNTRLSNLPAQRATVIPDPDSPAGRALLDSPSHPSLDGAPAAYNNFWFDWGTTIVGTRRTSLIVDPPHGRLPAKTEAGRARAAAMSARSSFSGRVAESHTDLSNSDRCLTGSNAGPPMTPGAYNNNVQLFQTPEYVALVNEMVHSFRIVPLGGRSGRTPDVRQWSGDSRGHWEGDTLVIETANFNDHNAYNTWRSTSQNMQLVERFTRVDADTLEYRFTVTDPETWESSWTAEVPMQRSDLPIYEFACHEGNYGLYNILAGDRIKEAEQAGR